MPFPLPNSQQVAGFFLEGPDAVKFGQRMFSRNIDGLAENAGALSAFLSAEGKILELFWVIRRPNSLLLICQQARVSGLKQLIERYHFAEAFTLKGDLSYDSFWEPSATADGSCKWTGTEVSGTWRGTHFTFKTPASAAPTDDFAQQWELHRIQSLLPEWAKDFDQSTLLFDIGAEEVCDPGKGCYVGQEVVERVRTRGGNVPRRLSVVSWDRRPNALSPIQKADGVNIGTTTSSIVEDDRRFYTLNFLKRNSALVGETVVESTSGAAGQVMKIL